MCKSLIPHNITRIKQTKLVKHNLLSFPSLDENKNNNNKRTRTYEDGLHNSTVEKVLKNFNFALFFQNYLSKIKQIGQANTVYDSFF